MYTESEREYRRRMRRRKRIIKALAQRIIILVAALVLLFIIIGGIVTANICRRACKVEAGEQPDYSHITSNGFVGLFSDLKTNPDDIDTSSPGTYTVESKLFGFISIKSKLTVVDTTMPVVTKKDLYVSKGIEITEDTFDVLVTDNTKVALKYNTDNIDVNTSGEYTISAEATDEGNNTARFELKLTVLEDDTRLFFKYATPAEDIEAMVKSIFTDITEIDLSGLVEVGNFRAKAESAENVYILNITIDELRELTLDVENILQMPELPNGCEVVSLAIVLNYLGYDVDSLWLFENYMAKSPYAEGDPWTTYIGDPTGKGLGCYAPCVVNTGNYYLSDQGSDLTVTDVSYKDMSEYVEYIKKGVPVIMWGLIDMNGNGRICWERTINGKKVDWHNYSHCLVMVGFTEESYVFCDPMRGIVEYDKEDVEKSFLINYEQACIIEKSN